MNLKKAFPFLLLIPLIVLAQGPGGGPPPLRKHTANETRPLQLVPATASLETESFQVFARKEFQRVVLANGIPDHRVGTFPNRGNPHTIEPQNYDYVLPADPKPADRITYANQPSSPDGRGAPNRAFGIALNGVLFDPGTAEFWNGDRELGWNYEALGSAVSLGLDENHAHVQPNGAYHYHGLPSLFLKQRGVTEGKHSSQIGWAADGFPIYALYGYKNPKDPKSEIVKLKSSYRIKSGDRPLPPDGPGGRSDGSFFQDYEFAEGSGDLDECSGRFCVTPEYPDGTYAYFLTENWPVIPRAFRGTPIELRGMGPPPGPGGPSGGKGKGKGKGPPPPPRR